MRFKVKGVVTAEHLSFMMKQTVYYTTTVHDYRFPSHSLRHPLKASAISEVFNTALTVGILHRIQEEDFIILSGCCPTWDWFYELKVWDKDFSSKDFWSVTQITELLTLLMEYKTLRYRPAKTQELLSLLSP